MPHALAVIPTEPKAPAPHTECLHPAPHWFAPARLGRAAKTSLPFVIAGTLAMTATGFATPSHAAPAKHFATPQLSPQPMQLTQPIVRSVPISFTTLSKSGVLPQSAVLPQSTVLPKSAVTAPKLAAQAVPADYTVVAGDTVSEIADRFGLSTQSILTANGLDSSSIIFPGQKLKLGGTHSAGTQAPATKQLTATTHTVASGDTMSGIAERTGSSLAELLAANGLVASSLIFPGQTIVVSAGTSAPSSAAPAAPESATRTHTVAAGDTMSGIAEKSGTSLSDLLAANSLVATSIIYPGQSILVPDAHFSLAATGSTALTAGAESEHIPEITMTAERRTNAETIIGVGRGAGVSDFGIVIALAAAMQESGLKNFDHGDRDSLGIFQQRPSTGWGTPAEVRDPKRAAQAFYGGPGNPNPGVTRGLLDIRGWQKMTVSEAAQAVQISGWPNHYAKWETAARAWLDQLG